MKGRISIFALSLFLLSFLWLNGTGHAGIPEPDNIIFGPFPAGSSQITLDVDGVELAAYTLGDIPIAGDNFVLRVPIDSTDPQKPGAARPGDLAMLYLDGETTPVETIVIGPPGSVLYIILPGAVGDADMDGYKDDVDNCVDVYNPDQDDANENGIGDACDGNSDTDGDGYSDMLEYIYFQSGRLDLDGNGYDPLEVNPPGDEGYVEPSQNNSNFWILFIPVILNAVEQGQQTP